MLPRNILFHAAVPRKVYAFRTSTEAGVFACDFMALANPSLQMARRLFIATSLYRETVDTFATTRGRSSMTRNKRQKRGRRETRARWNLQERERERERMGGREE